ncbi:hypothetical protein GMORB2_4550 [Geosmithia morbida]|uniref:Uncharacterized protein n=1 Tax=Geosmithia morbida TaxID=1094350 RepID=A0A9P5D0P1_9HYPO|nr:uncharacterized protein GMORB2_4550 [Geosmithia morbida]KAF4119641.1 hypothetical protein GMORB2_4550 [Geosmithia morbida]
MMTALSQPRTPNTKSHKAPGGCFPTLVHAWVLHSMHPCSRRDNYSVHVTTTARTALVAAVWPIDGTIIPSRGSSRGDTDLDSSSSPSSSSHSRPRSRPHDSQDSGGTSPINAIPPETAANPTRTTPPGTTSTAGSNSSTPASTANIASLAGLLGGVNAPSLPCRATEAFPFPSTRLPEVGRAVAIAGGPASVGAGHRRKT